MENTIIELFIENQKVDLFEQIDIFLTKNINDIQSPVDIKNDFSKTVQLPSTPNNNKVFGYIFNPNKIVYSNTNTNIGIDFNPARRANFRLMYNGALYMSGYIKMTNIIVEKEGVWTYEINLFGELGNFFYKMGDSTLEEILSYSGSPYNQTFFLDKETIYNLYRSGITGKTSRDNVTNLAAFYATTNTIDPNLDNNGSYYSNKFIDIVHAYNGYNTANKIQYAPSYNTDNTNSETPLDRSYDEMELTSILCYKQRFGLYVDMLLKNIGTALGYTIDFGDFEDLDNPYWFKTMVTCPMLTTVKDLDTATVTLTGEINGGLIVPEANPSGFAPYTSLTIDDNTRGWTTDGTNINRNSGQTSQFFSVKYDLRGELYIWGFPTAGILRQFEAWDNNCGIDVRFSMFDQQIGYAVAVPVEFQLRSASIASATDDPLVVEFMCQVANGQTEGEVYVKDKITNSWVTFYSYAYDYVSNNYISKTMPATIYQFQLTLTKLYNTGNNQFIKDQNSIDYYYTEVGLEYKNNANSANISITALATIKSGVKLPITAYIPPVKTFDFFISYVKMFGLYMTIDDINKTVSIKNRNDFYSGYQILDWSSKLVRDNSINYTVLNFDKNRLRFGYKKDNNTTLSKMYFDNTGKYYGDKTIVVGYDFNNEVYDVLEGNIFEPIISRTINERDYYGRTGRMIFPCLYTGTQEKKDLANPIGLVFSNQLLYTITGQWMSDIHVKITDDSGLMYDKNEFFHNLEYYKIDYVLTPVTSDPYYMGKVLHKLNSEMYFNKLVKATGAFYGDTYYGFTPISAVTHSLSFGRPDEVYVDINDSMYDEDVCIYDRYWKKFIEDRYNVNTKIMTAYFNLNALEVQMFNFKNFIFIDNVLWTVNKIEDFDLANQKPTKVELVRVNDITNYTTGQNPF